MKKLSLLILICTIAIITQTFARDIILPDLVVKDAGYFSKFQNHNTGETYHDALVFTICNEGSNYKYHKSLTLQINVPIRDNPNNEIRIQDLHTSIPKTNTCIYQQVPIKNLYIPTYTRKIIVTAKIDPYNKIREKYETNNHLRKDIAIKPIIPFALSKTRDRCQWPFVYHNEKCVPKESPCITTPLNAIASSCVDRITGGKKYEQNYFQCQQGYKKVGKRCWIHNTYPDLVIEDIQMKSIERNFIPIAKVCNKGLIPAPFYFDVKMDISIQNQSVSTTQKTPDGYLEADTCRDIVLDSFLKLTPFTNDQYTVKITADAKNKIREENEKNNHLTRKLHLTFPNTPTQSLASNPLPRKSLTNQQKLEIRKKLLSKRPLRLSNRKNSAPKRSRTVRFGPFKSPRRNTHTPLINNTKNASVQIRSNYYDIRSRMWKRKSTLGERRTFRK